MSKERSNASVLQPFETPDELDLRRETAISAVEYVAGYENRSSMTIYTEVDHALVSIERGTPKDLRNLRLRLTNALKRAVEGEGRPNAQSERARREYTLLCSAKSRSSVDCAV